MLFSGSVSLYVWAFAIAILSTGEAVMRKPRSTSTCRKPTIFQNFDLTSASGHWYEYSRFDNNLEKGCDCTTSQITLVDATSIQASTCCQFTSVSNDTQTCNIGITNIRIDKNDGLFSVTLNGVESQLWVVDTDYENFMIVDACLHVSDDEEHELFWIMTRDKEINESEAKRINEVLEANHYDKNKIIKQRHGSDICTSKRPQIEHGNSGLSNMYKKNSIGLLNLFSLGQDS